MYEMYFFIPIYYVMYYVRERSFNYESTLFLLILKKEISMSFFFLLIY
jgi:hypothetical protein